MNVGGSGKKDSFQVRLPPDILKLIDDGVVDGKWTSRSDFVYRSALMFLFRESLTADAREYFRKVLLSEEYRQYIKGIVQEETDRFVNLNHK